MMTPTLIEDQAPVAPPSFKRAQARQSRALHIDALTLVTTLHLLALCRLAVRLARRRCPPPLPAGKGGRPRSYSEESLLLISLLRTLWRLSVNFGIPWLSIDFGDKVCNNKTRKRSLWGSSATLVKL